MLSRHRTRQGALDAWREKVPRGTEVRIVRTYSDGQSIAVVEGRWLAEDEDGDPSAG